MSENLTEAERKCCHMGQFGLDGSSLESWRDEFRSIPQSEHCRDCPAVVLQERGCSMSNPEVTLDSLVGEHVLDAVDTFTESVKQTYGDYFENCEFIRFRLDGKVYTAIEDPSDGYRSSLGSLIVSPDGEMRNVFPPCRVVGKMKENDAYSINETLQLIDAVTGEIVLEVGTDNTDDYYPSFVGSFWPECMAVNEGASLPRPPGEAPIKKERGTPA
jgi:hypothetical protein